MSARRAIARDDLTRVEILALGNYLWVSSYRVNDRGNFDEPADQRVSALNPADGRVVKSWNVP